MNINNLTGKLSQTSSRNMQQISCYHKPMILLSVEYLPPSTINLSIKQKNKERESYISNITRGRKINEESKIILSCLCQIGEFISDINKIFKEEGISNLILNGKYQEYFLMRTIKFQDTAYMFIKELSQRTFTLGEKRIIKRILDLYYKAASNVKEKIFNRIRVAKGIKDLSSLFCQFSPLKNNSNYYIYNNGLIKDLMEKTILEHKNLFSTEELKKINNSERVSFYLNFEGINTIPKDTIPFLMALNSLIILEPIIHLSSILVERKEILKEESEISSTLEDILYHTEEIVFSFKDLMKKYMENKSKTAEVNSIKDSESNLEKEVVNLLNLLIIKKSNRTTLEEKKKITTTISMLDLLINSLVKKYTKAINPRSLEDITYNNFQQILEILKKKGNEVIKEQKVKIISALLKQRLSIDFPEKEIDLIPLLSIRTFILMIIDILKIIETTLEEEVINNNKMEIEEDITLTNNTINIKNLSA